MIDINLVPVELRKKSPSKKLWAVPLDVPTPVIMAAGGLLALLLLAHVALLGVWVVKGLSLNVRKGTWQKMLPQKNNIDAVGTKIKESGEKLKAIDAIVVSKSVGWSRRLNVISDALTKGMWLNKLNLDATALTIEGSAVSKNQGEITLVSTFVANLKKDEAFMKDFSSIEVSSVQKTKRGATEISDFIVTAKLK